MEKMNGMSDKNKVLTDLDVQNLKGMSLYWKEIRERQDKFLITILSREAVSVQTMLGIKILGLVEHYLELLDKEERKNG